MPTIKHSEVNTIDAWLEGDQLVLVVTMNCGGYWELTRSFDSSLFDWFVPEGC